MPWRWVRVVAFLSVATGCSSGGEDAPVTTVRIATNQPGGVSYPLAQVLVGLYDSVVPGVQVRVDAHGSSDFNLAVVDQGSAELAFARADTLYNVYTYGLPDDPTPKTHLRGIGNLYRNVLHVLVRSDSSVQRLADLRGAKVAYSAPVDRLRSPSSLGFLAAGGVIESGDIRGVGMRLDDVVRAVAAGDVEGGLLLSGYPFAAVNQISAETRLRLIGVAPDVATRIRGEYPFFKPMEIPAGTYPGQDALVMTIGVEYALVCREDLEEGLVYLLTRAIFEDLPLMPGTPILSRVDALTAAATPIPLHPGAARYYRERELVH